MTEATHSWSVRANYWNSWRAVGGHLAVGGGELAFTPHFFDRLLLGKGFRARLGDIVDVTVERSGAIPRKRIFVRTTDGETARFLVPEADEVAARIDAARAAA